MNKAKSKPIKSPTDLKKINKKCIKTGHNNSPSELLPPTGQTEH